MRLDEIRNLAVERKGAYAQQVEDHAVALKDFGRLMHGGTCRAVIDHAERCLARIRSQDRCGNQRLGRVELAQQPFHVLDIVGPFFRIARVAVLCRATGEIGTARRMCAGIGPEGNTVAVYIEVTAELLAGLKLLGRQDLAAIEGARVVPVERCAEAMVRTDVEIEHDEDGGLQPFRQIERLRAHGEGLIGILRQQQDMLGVAVGGIGAGQNIRLLGARRDAGGWTAALHIEQDRWNFGEIGEAKELLHERDTRTGCCGEGPGTVPAGSHHHADGGEFVLGLHDGVFRAPLRVGAQALAIAHEEFGQGGRRRDRIPRADAGAAIDRAECCSLVALDEDTVAHGIGALDTQANRAGEMRLRIFMADVQRLDIWRDEFFLALELLADQGFDDRDLDVEQRRERADIDDVLEELAQTRFLVTPVADFGQRHADNRDVVAEFRSRYRARRIVEQVPARLQAGDILCPGLRVHRNEQVRAAACAQMSGAADADLVPGGKALDV